MKLISLKVVNFRAITSLEIENLDDAIVIAGPNGCGKSCIFDAIRLLKSVYGGYQENEWQQWFGEFQINVNQSTEGLLSVFQDKSKSLQISASFALSDDEKGYLSENLRELALSQIWLQVAGAPTMKNVSLATNMRQFEPQVLARLERELPILEQELALDHLKAEFSVTTEGNAVNTPSPLLEVVFGVYEPENIGIIDYHGANRTYNREQVGGINLNIESSDQQMKQSALYNYQNKYANLKTQMASSYIRGLLATNAGEGESGDFGDSLSETLEELFSTFFPGKEFLGPLPTKDGRLDFPVKTLTGAVHDINELSSGEKEVLYGYLRLRNTAPKNSILLLDEPELHLNPRLVSGLARFYQKHLGLALGNQLWLVTHSDTLIRDSVGQDGFNVFHMQPPGTYDGENQLTPVAASEDIERVVIDLVGDLAVYRPGAKIVLFEGGGDQAFDVQMTCTLFPQLRDSVNAISAGNKAQVNKLYSLLEQIGNSEEVAAKFYAITDRDWQEGEGLPARVFQWDVFHIENYLLEPSFILVTLKDLQGHNCIFGDESAVLSELSECAETTLEHHIRHSLQTHTNELLVRQIRTSFDPRSNSYAAASKESVDNSIARIRDIVNEELTLTKLESIEQELIEAARSDLADGTWRQSFRGREILKEFLRRHCDQVNYEAFRDLIVARMRDADYQPNGMKLVIDQILADDGL